MSEYLSNDEEKEKLMEWWKENGRFIVTGVGLGLIGIFAWRAWTGHLDTQAGDAAVVYEELTIAFNSDDDTKANELLSKMSTKYKSTSYVAQAYLLKARKDVESKNLSEAINSLESAIAASKDPQLTELANFRLAKLHLATQDYTAVLADLKKVKTKAFAPLVAELEGDLYFAQGDISKARAAYETAKLAMQETPVGDPNLLQMKLSDLGAAESSAQ